MGVPVGLPAAGSLMYIFLRGTSASQQESAKDGNFATTSYAARKRAYLDTESHCQDEGLPFIPMAVEASCGSWGSDARRVFHGLSKKAALLTGDLPSEKFKHFYQSL